jgi:hypothetical protein
MREKSMRTLWLSASAIVAALLASAGPIQAQPVKWRAVSILEGGDSKNCGATLYTKYDVEVSDKLLTTRINGSAYVYRLQAALKPDGSGKVIGLSEKNQPVTFDFEPGTGPRPIRFMPPYSVCVWTLRPV